MRFGDRRRFGLLPTAIAAVALGTFIGACDVDQTREGEMPDVDVRGDAGELPEYEVRKVDEGRAPDLDVDVQGGQLPEVEVEGPDVEIKKDTVEVPVPDVDIEMPDEDELDETP